MTTRTRLRLAALVPAVALVVSGSARAQDNAPQTEDEKTLYFLGVYVGKNLASRYHLEEGEIDMVTRGLEESLKGQAVELDETTYGPKLNELARARTEKAVEAEKVAGQAYLDEMAAEDGATRTDSGLIFLETKAGEGTSPTADDTVTAHYHGTFRDGKVFDSSIDRGRPADFKLTGVIRCWTEALQMMKVGGKAKITCPPDLAYGDRGAPPAIPGGAVLTFDVELVAIKP